MRSSDRFLNSSAAAARLGVSAKALAAILDKALEEAGIDRRASYLTNAVKHFKDRKSTRLNSSH